MLEQHLRQAEEHVVRGRQHIVRQMQLIAKLERDGHDTLTARRLLATFEELQEAHEADRDRINKELAELDRRSI